MAKTQVKVLAEYQRLKSRLNSSGAQKWNPAVYEILNQLIDFISQSQDVIEEPKIIKPFIVDPLGALEGDGTEDTPLKVKVDNASITIDLITNVLKAVHTAATIEAASFDVTVAEINAGLNKPLIGASGVVQLLCGTAHCNVTDIRFVTTGSPAVCYSNRTSVPIMTFGNLWGNMQFLNNYVLVYPSTYSANNISGGIPSGVGMNLVLGPIATTSPPGIDPKVEGTVFYVRSPY
jgi:hypothetical protein